MTLSLMLPVLLHHHLPIHQIDANYQRMQKAFGPPISESNRFEEPYTADESAAKVTEVILKQLDLEAHEGILISEYADQQWV